MTSTLSAQVNPSATSQIFLYGIRLVADPPSQVVPKDIGTIVSTYLQAPNFPDGTKAPIPDGAEMRATLRGPSLEQPRELIARPNSPFAIPPLTVPGIHTLDNIRLVKGDQVLLYAEPETVQIEVIERLLVTKVTARALTAAEIREKGLVFDSSSFQAFNFTAAFAVANGKQIQIDFPVILPTVAGTTVPGTSTANFPSIKVPGLKSISTIIADTLQIQSLVPNLSVTGFVLTYKPEKGKEITTPAIPGVVVVPGDVGFLNQVFSVLLMVGNVAPDGSKLVVSDATAEIVLPPGNDQVVLTADDPLRMGRTASGETARIQRITQAGGDNKLGTGDDATTIGPGETGNAEFLIEGVREGNHIVEMEIAATLNGLPIGPVPIRGRAAGSVLVRNPTFTLTFTHPDVVNAGEPYTLDVTVTNTSPAPANFVSVNLNARNIVGATLPGTGSQQIDTILPGDSATLTYSLISRVNGKVTAGTLDSDGKVAGRFELKAAVGELGVPLSPDSLVLPKEANVLPADLRNAALGLLGRAYAVATAPPAAVPPDITRFTRKIVWDRAVEVAEAGLRVSLHEPLADSVAHLWMDFAGSNYARLSERVTKPENLPFEETDYQGFDQLRRKSVRGDVFAGAVGTILRDPLVQQGAVGFHLAFAEKMTYRPGHISVLLSAANGGPVPATLTVTAAGQRLGGAAVENRFAKEIPFSDFLPIRNAQGEPIAYLALIATPEAGPFTIDIARTPANATPLTLSVVTPDGNGNLRHAAFENIVSQTPVAPASPQTPYPYTVRLFNGSTPAGGPPMPASRSGPVNDPAPTALGVVQMKDADLILCEDEILGRPGRIIAVVFSEEVTKASVQDGLDAGDITNFTADGNQVVAVALQPGRRIAFLALRDPIGPFVPRSLTVSGVTDRRNQAIGLTTMTIESTVDEPGGVVSGRVLQADGTPVPSANVRLIYMYACGDVVTSYGISSKTTAEDGSYSWDYVLQNPVRVHIAAIDPLVDQPRSVGFNVQRDGQRLNVDLVFLGRGTLRGRALAPDGVTPVAGAVVRATSLTDRSQYGALTDDAGRFTLLNVPVGNVLIEAVHVSQRLEGVVAEFLAFPGVTVDRDLILFSIGDGSVIQKGRLRGQVLRSDGVTPVARVPVILYYKQGSQAALHCDDPEALECPVAVTETDTAGAFDFPAAYAGSHRVYAFDQGSLQEGSALVTLPANGEVAVAVLLAGGLGRVRGVVLDASGAPVPGAKVGGGFTIATTDAAGQFLLTDVPVGRREITAVSEALKTRGTAVVDIPAPGAEVPVAVVLTAIASIAGRVSDVAGVAVSNNKVYLFERLRVPEGSDPKINVIAQVVTDENGQYLIERIAVPDRNAQYFVSAFRSDMSDGNVVPVALRFQNQVFRADITFKGGGRGTVVGRVFDSDGTTPLAALVGISGERPLIAGGLVGIGFQYIDNYRVVETDFTTGQFSFSDVWAGRFVLRAAGQFSPDPVSAEGQMPPGAATVELNLRLAPTGRITGTVFQPDGATPAGAGVIVRFKSEAFKIVCSTNAVGDETCTAVPQGIQNEQVVTGADGRYTLPLVNAGAYSLTAEDPATGRVARIKGEMKPGQNPEVSIRLLGLGNVTVRVLGSDAQTAIPDADVVLTEAAYPSREVTLRAGPDGVIEFAGGNAVNEGEFTVLATDRRNGFAGRATGRVTRDGEQVTVRVFLYDAWGTVSGTVFAPDRTTPVANAEITLSNDLGPLAFAVTDATGVYQITQVPLGPFSIDAFSAATARRGFATGSIDVNQQEVPVVIYQLGMGVVKGRVLRSGDLEPLVNWEVSLSQTSPSGRALEPLLTSSGLDGEYRFPGVSEGQVQISARHHENLGQGSTTAILSREGQTLDLPVIVTVSRPLAGRLQGIVLNADQSPAPASVIEVAIGTATLFATADGDGRFTVENVPLGRFTVTARSQATRNVGTTVGEILFENHVEVVTVTLVGLSQVTGVVERQNGEPAPNAEVHLDGVPASGCFETCSIEEVGCSPVGTRPVICSAFADALGHFTFSDVPARTFSIVARDPVSSLSGGASGTLIPGQGASVRVVLAAAATITGRAILGNGTPVAGAAAEIALPPLTAGGEPRLFYIRGKPDGTFRFEGIALGSYTLTITDPLGSGLARRVGTLTGNLALGDIVLDDSAPAVVLASPLPGATQIPRNAAIRLTFSEPIAPGTVTPENVTLSTALGSVAGVLTVSDGDTVVTFTPLALLKDQTLHTLTVSRIEDRLGKAMAAGFSLTFQTVDITPPAVIDLTPLPSSNGVTIYTTVRAKYSEPIDPTKYRGPPIRLTYSTGSGDGQGGGDEVPVDGRIDFLFGNTVVVFTPARPLDEDRTYTARFEQAFDLSGLAEVSPRTVTFSTTDRTPPQLAGLSASNNGRVITNSFIDITANTGTSHDVALVDFFVNGVFTSTARLAPFVLRLQAVPALGHPGDQIRVEAFGVDTSGNRSTSAVQVLVLIVADSAPGVVIEGPVSGRAFRNGDRVDVQVRATDDLGVSRLAYRAVTGRPGDAEVKAYDPAPFAQTQLFAFNVPADATPGSSIVIEATAVDTKGEQTAAVPISITVLDSIPPTVSIGGVVTGDRLRPNQTVNAVVSAEDLGGIASITFTTTGVVATSASRTIDPARSPVLASFAFTVPATARPGDSVNLDATAIDRAGNKTAAARIILPIADTVPPTVTLRTATGRLDIAPGQTIAVIADAEDELAVASVRLTGEGAFTLSDAKQVSPPSGSAAVPFTITAPANAVIGSVLTLTAHATDTSNNTGPAATLTLTVRASADVVLPSSALVAAGETQLVTISVPGGAAEGGLRVDLASSDPTIATVPAFVTFAAGESTRSFALSGVSGGVAEISASVQGTPRAVLTATVRGGIVSGIVLSPTLQPVANAQVTITSSANGTLTFPTVTGADGRFFVEGANNPAITVRALDPVSHLLGFTATTLNRANGYATVQVVLVAAGSIAGTVRLPDGTTSAGPNVRVELWDVTALTDPVAATVTNASGGFEFPLVPIGTYRLDASDLTGNRGRSTVAVTTSGQTVDAQISYLGRGTVTGTVRDAANAAVPNAQLRFSARSIFGDATPIVTNALNDGTFRFDGVLVGQFTVVANDEATGQAGTATGELQTHGQVVPIEVRLSAWGGLTGVLYRQDGTTPVAGARVTAGGISTTTDTEGRYTLSLLPLGPYTLSAEEPATRGLARVTGALTTHAVTETVNLRLFDQASLLVTVTTAGGVPEPDAVLSIAARNGAVSDTLFARTGSDGTVLVQHVLAGTFEIEAHAGTLAGGIAGTLPANTVTPATVVLEGTASIAGIVFLPDGVNPASSGQVVIDGRQYPVGTDGRYRADGLRLREQTVQVRDALGRLRARATVSLTDSGEVHALNLTMIALGTVVGRVINPDASSASSMLVVVRSNSSLLGGFYSAMTDAAGFYEILNVPAGPFSVSTGDLSRGLLGEGSGSVSLDEEVVTVDVLLVANAVSLPVTRDDANNFVYAIQPDGAVTAAPAEESKLDIVVGGQAVRFAGASFGTSEQAGRELATRQQNVSGLNITRKIFVPVDGYFSRHLEIVSNPTTAPVTFDLRISANFALTSGFPVQVVRTSSGGDAFTPAVDRWVVVDDESDVDPFLAGGHAAEAFVLDGPGGRLQAAAVASDGAVPTEVSYRWNGIVLPPGGTVAVLRFHSRQASRDGAAGAAARLVQLPPEALTGLSAEELGWISNFVMPSGGSSSLAPLPALTGVVSGTVVAVDRTTRLAGVPVTFASSLPFYGRRWTATTDADGRFSFTGIVAEGASLPIPVAPFTLRAVYPATGIASPDLVAAFAAGSTTADTLVVFGSEATPPVITSVEPSSGGQGTSLRVAVTGQFTNFAAGSTSASFGPDIAVTAVNVASPTSATFDISISPTAAVGPRMLTFTSEATTAQYWAFSVTAGNAAVASVTPNVASQGRSLDVAITGSGTHFSPGATAVNFGDGITVQAVAVTSPTTAVAAITIAAAAPVGARTVTVTTGGEVATLTDAFSVRAARPSTLVRHLGSADPVTEGFTASPYPYIFATQPVSDDGGFPAWQITSPFCCGMYSQQVDTSLAFIHGWRLAARARVVSGTGRFAVELNPIGERRFNVDVTPVGADAVVTLGGSSLAYTVADGANRWILLELLYNPLNREATLAIDGVQRLAGYPGWSTSQENGVVFGAPGGDSVVNVNLVSFALATDVIDFEDQPAQIPLHTDFPADYRGVAWSNWRHTAPIPAPYQTDGSHAIYAAADDASLRFAERVFIGADFSRAPGATGDIYFELYRRGSLVHTSGPLADTAPELTFLASGYAGTVDEVRVRSLESSMTPTGAAWMMDNVTFGAEKVKFRPQVSWNPPADIVYGTALGDEQLNAQASVPGAFVYDPPAGRVLSAGAGQTLSARFTPAEPLDYEEVTATVLINVLRAPQAALAVLGAPESAAQGVSFTVTAIGGSGTGAVTFSATGACGSSGGGLITMTSGTGLCAITATRAGDSNYEPATSPAVIVLTTGSVPPKLNVLETTAFIAVAANNVAIPGQLNARLEATGISVAAPAGGVPLSAVSSAPGCVAVSGATLAQGALTVGVPVTYGGSAPLPCEATVTMTTTSFGADSAVVKVYRYADANVFTAGSTVSFYNPAPIPTPGGTQASGVAAVSYYNPAPVPAPGGVQASGVAALSYYNPAPIPPPGGTLVSGTAAVSYYNPAPVPGPDGSIVSGLSSISYSNPATGGSAVAPLTSPAEPEPAAIAPAPIAPAAGTSDAAASATVAISIANGPVASSVVPVALSRVSPTPYTLTIRGAGLNGATTVTFIGLEQDVQAGTPVVSDDGRTLTIEVFVLPSAAPGVVEVVVVGPGWRTPAVPTMRVEIRQ